MNSVSVMLSLFVAGVLSAAEPVFTQTHKPEFYPGSEFPGARGSLSVDENGVVETLFDFSGGGNYVETFFDLPEKPALKCVTFKADKTQGYSFTIRVVDANGQTFQKPVNHSAAGWNTFRFDMNNWTGHWGGLDDGVLQQPVKRFSILLENTKQPENKGRVLLKDISYETLTDEELSSQKMRSGKLCSRYVVTDFGGGVVNAFERRTFGSHPGGVLQNGVLKVDFSRTDFASASHSLPILGVPEELLLTIEADAAAAGAELELGIGSHFMVYTKIIGKIRKPIGNNHKVWQTFAVPAPPAEGWSWHGGANDGKPNYPLRFSHLNIRRNEAEKKPVTIRMVSLEACTRIQRTKSIALRTRLLPNGQCPLQITGELKNLDDIPHEGILEVNLRNWDEQVVGTVRTNLSALLPGQTRIFTMDLPRLSDNLNFVEALCSYNSSMGVKAEWRPTWTAVSENDGSAEKKPDLPWGMGIFLYRNGNNEDGFANMNRMAGMAQAAGVKWSREEFQWQRIEPRRGEFDFSFYDKMLDIDDAHGISVYALVCYWTDWTKPYEEEGFKDYCNFLRTLVRRYKGRIKHWEIYNEPNIFFWSGPRERYPELLKMAYEAVKAEDPDALVLGCSTAGIDNKFVQMCLDNGAPFDILTIHPYRAVLHEESFIRELTQTREQIGGRQNWITEMGWPTVPGNATERQQASRLVRSYLSAVGSGACNNISWYNFRNDGWNSYYNEENFGILYQDLVPKPAYRALASVCRTFPEGKPILTAVPLKSINAKGWLFCMGGASALWTDSIRVTFAFKADKEPEIRNLVGERIPARKENGEWLVEADEGHPLFFPKSVISDIRVADVPANAVPEVISF